MKSFINISSIYFLLMFLSPITQADLKADFQQAHNSFLNYIDETEGDFEQPWGFFSKLDADYPNHPAVQVYFGSMETIKARDAWMPWTKIKWVERGLDRMDRALSLLKPKHRQQFLINTSVTLDTQIAAASTFVAVPAFLNRLQDGKDLFADIQQGSDVSTLDAKLQHSIYLIGKSIAEKEKNKAAVISWQKKIKALKLNP